MSLKAALRPILGWHFPLVLLVTLLGVTLAYQFDTRHAIDVGEYYDRVYLSGFHDREPPPEAELPPGGERYRWSEAQAEVLFPGVGARGRLLTLRLHGWRPQAEAAPEVRISVNGILMGRATAGPTWQEYQVWVPAEAVGDGTVRVGLETAPFIPAESGVGDDPRSLGLAVSWAELVPLGEGGPALAWPAWDQLGYALLAVAALYLALAAIGLPRGWAALAAGLAVVPLSYFLAWQRLWTTIYTQRLAIVAGLGLLLVLLLRWLFQRLLVWGGVTVSEKGARLLLAVFWVSFLLKAGGLLYPYSVAWDLKLQLHWSSWILEGRLPQLYGTQSPLSELTMPEEWGEEKPLIPYSPFYHMTAALFYFLPWRPYDTANVLSVLLDTTRPLLLYFLARRLGLSPRAGLWAALLYAALPATFLLHAWGNTPTTAGLWWTFAAICYMVGAWERLKKPLVWAGLVFFLLGALLFYTVTAAFMVLCVLLLLLGLACNGRGLQERSRGAVLLALVAAIGLSLAIYYGQFIGPVATQTIPRVLESLRQGGTSLGVEPVSWSQYLRDHLARLGNLRDGRVLLGPLALAAIGFVSGWRRSPAEVGRRPLRRWLLIAWLATALVFFLVGFRVDMVDKEIWFVLPAVALCAGVALDWYWQKGPAGRAVGVGIILFLALAALHIWFLRLVTVQQAWVNADAQQVGEALGRWDFSAWQTLLGR